MIKTNCILFLLIVFCSCGNLDVYERDQSVPGAKWPAELKYRFEYNATDTITTYDVFINLRHDDLYKYNNIFLFVTTVAPNGISIADTIEFMIANNKGKWYGSGVGNIYDLRLNYKEGVKFGQLGRYVFFVQQGMREKELIGVTDVGIRIAKSK